MIYFLNGQFLPEAAAKISLNDLALLRGFGVFDYLKTVNRKPLFLNSYLDRFMNSAKTTGLTCAYSSTELANIVHKLIELNPGQECGIRMVLTGGYSPDDFTYHESNFFILIKYYESFNKIDYSNGVGVLSYPFQREWPEAKIINYATPIIINERNRGHNFAEILYHQQGFITEASRSNFFVIKGNSLITAENGVLKGITRQTVLDLAKSHFQLAVENYPLEKLYDADEAFITSSTKGILPVVKVDDRNIGSGKPGKSTKFLIKQYNDLLQALSL